MRKSKKSFIPKSGARKVNKGNGSAASRKKPIKTEGYTPDERRIISVLKAAVEGAEYASRALLRDSKVKSKKAFYDALHKLKDAGVIAVDAKHNVSLVKTEKGIEAELISLSSGFGFARAEDGRDVFIHGSALKGAFIGDKLILTDMVDSEKGFNARVKRITDRAKTTVVGTIKTDYNRIFLVPDAPIRFNLEVRTSDLNGAKEGDKVLAQARLDRRGDWRYARVKSIFGDAQSARICADAIIVSAGIPNEFPEQVISEAILASQQEITDEDIRERIDLRAEPIFTIDGADAKDLDDAISVYKTDTGYKLGVHIADVSHYVKENSALDKEAFSRGTSVYFADRVIPMLPVQLSNGSCSLNADTDKLTFSALIDFDTDGEIVDFDFKKSIMRSKVRGVYSEVNEILACTADDSLKDKYSPVMDCLIAANELADVLMKRAKQRGEMEIESDELYFVLDENGKCVDIKPRTTGKAERLIEQMMVSANIAAARFSQKYKLPFLYRVHEKPQPDKISELCEILDRIGIDCKEIKKSKPSTADFAAVLDRAKETTKHALVSQRILRTMEKAHYSEVEVGHFGLSLDDYSHFTSPIRRYPDTSIHRIMSAFLETRDSDKIKKRYEEFAKESAAESSKCEVRAVSAERSAEDCYAAEYALLHLGEEHIGVISGATARGIFVKLQNGIEGFVSLSDFAVGDFVFDGMITHTNTKTGFSLTVGDQLAVIIAAAEVSSGRIDFMPRNVDVA